MMIPERLITKRLYLRRAIKSDAKSLFQHYFSDPVSAKYLIRSHHTDINQSKNVLNNWCDLAWDKKNCSFAWVIALQESNEAIGIFLVEYANNQSVKIHYGIGRNFSNIGLITEAGRAVINWLLKNDVKKISTECNCNNSSSIRVLEKLGFKNEGISKTKLVFPALGSEASDCYLYNYLVVPGLDNF